MTRVVIPPLLHSYTGGVSVVEEHGRSLAEVLEHLDSRYRGLRFRIVDEQDRIRPHIRIFVGGRMARTIDHPLDRGAEIKILGALSGG